MSNKKYIRDNVSKILPIETEIIGDNIFENIIDRQMKGLEIQLRTSKEGKNLELATIIELVATLVSTIDLILKLIEYKKKKKEKINEEEILQNVKQGSNLTTSEYDDFLFVIIRENKEENS